MGKLSEKMASIFGSSDTLPWTDDLIIKNCEKEVASEGAGISVASDCSESIMRLAWALVHSHVPSDVQRGIAMLEASFVNANGQLQRRETLYLLAVGHFRAGDYSRSRRLVDQALEISPEFRQALTLKKMVEKKIAKDGVIGMGLAVAAVGIVASGVGVAVSLARKK